MREIYEIYEICGSSRNIKHREKTGVRDDFLSRGVGAAAWELRNAGIVWLKQGGRANVWATIYMGVDLQQLAYCRSTPENHLSINGMPVYRLQTAFFLALINAK